MPVRGFLVVLAVALAAAAGWFFYIRNGGLDLNGPTVSRDITVPAEAETDTGLPRFDIVRIDAAGKAVISGHATAGAKVTIRAGERPIGDATANNRGEWVIVVEKPLKGAAEITASALATNGSVAASDESVITYVPKQGSTPLAILERANGPSHILQRPDELGVAPLAVEVADYIEGGRLLISGRSAPKATVRIYIDNDPCGTAQADNLGNWTLEPQAILPGAYTMRVDQLGPKGSVAARIEVPFERANPDLVAGPILGTSGLGIETGVTQWRIARRSGAGFQLTVLYPANQDQVRDPNLIYPGQIFETPEASLEQ